MFMRAWVRECVHACVRIYTYVCLLYVERGSSVENAELAIEREVFESPLIPFRSLGIVLLFTMPQFTQLYK